MHARVHSDGKLKTAPVHARAKNDGMLIIAHVAHRYRSVGKLISALVRSQVKRRQVGQAGRTDDAQ